MPNSRQGQKTAHLEYRLCLFLKDTPCNWNVFPATCFRDSKHYLPFGAQTVLVRIMAAIQMWAPELSACQEERGGEGRIGKERKIPQWVHISPRHLSGPRPSSLLEWHISLPAGFPLTSYFSSSTCCPQRPEPHFNYSPSSDPPYSKAQLQVISGLGPSCPSSWQRCWWLGQGLDMQPWLVCHFLCRWGWTQAHTGSPGSGFPGSGLQMCSATCSPFQLLVAPSVPIMSF